MNSFTSLFRFLTKKNKTIFIVEDNQVYAKSLAGFLQMRFPGSTILIFSDGAACLQELHLNPRVIIMDYLLNTSHSDAPTGLATIKEIKSKSADSNIILLSVKTELNVFVNALALYGCTYLKKDQEAFHKIEQFVKSKTNIPSHSI